MTATPTSPPGPAGPALAAQLADLRDTLAGLGAEQAAAAANTEHRLNGLAERLAVIEQGPAAGQPAAGYPYRYGELGDWVDEVFTRIAARHRAKWCTAWEQHLDARLRLEVLWHTWEAAHAAPPGAAPTWAAVDEWLRVILDHHAGVLLDVDGPFAGCVPHTRCAPAPRLAQRALDQLRAAAVARLDAHRRRARATVGAP